MLSALSDLGLKVESVQPLLTNLSSGVMNVETVVVGLPQVLLSKTAVWAASSQDSEDNLYKCSQ